MQVPAAKGEGKGKGKGKGKDNVVGPQVVAIGGGQLLVLEPSVAAAGIATECPPPETITVTVTAGAEATTETAETTAAATEETTASAGATATGEASAAATDGASATATEEASANATEEGAATVTEAASQATAGVGQDETGQTQGAQGFGGLGCNIARLQIVRALGDTGNAVAQIQDSATQQAAEAGLIQANAGIESIAQALVAGEAPPQSGRDEVEAGLVATGNALASGDR